MGQEQSVAGGAGDSRGAASGSSAAHALAEGVREVVGSGAALRAAAPSGGAELLRASRALPLPRPVLASAVDAGSEPASVLHELRAALNGLGALGLNALLPPSAVSVGPSPAASDGASDAAAAAERGDAVPLAAVMAAKHDTSREQMLWARLAVDEGAVAEVLAALDGGERARAAVQRQREVAGLVAEVKMAAERLLQAVHRADARSHEFAVVADKVDRLTMDVTDVQESLQGNVATANILGAAHFAEDEEMRSFKDFLKFNPPVVKYPSAPPGV